MIQDRARGMIDVPLSPKGESEADYLGRRIAAKGGIDTLVSSPMTRAMETVGAILKHNHGARFIGIAPGFSPLHQAGLEGRQRDEVEPAMRHFSRHPDQRIPGLGPSGVPGESLDEHDRRIWEATKQQLRTLMPGERRLLVTHHSAIRALRGRFKHGGKQAGPEEMADPYDVAKPAGEILRLVKRDGKPDLESNPLDSDEPIKPGLNITRHGATELNEGSTGNVVGRLAHRKALLS